TPNKAKQNQINPSKKAWISLDSFGRIGTFQWVTTNPNKKIFSLITLWPNYHKSHSSALSLEAGPQGHGFDLTDRKTYNMNLVFQQENVGRFAHRARSANQRRWSRERTASESEPKHSPLGQLLAASD